MTEHKNCDNLDQRIQDGDNEEELIEAVAQCLYEEVKRFAQSRCGDRQGDAEDISQDALLAARRYLSSFRGEASLRTWLYRLVLSACSRRRRGRKNDPNLHRPLDDTDNDPEPADPEMILMMSERLSALEEAMRELRPEDQRMLTSVEWQGQSLQQVAETSGLTVSAVKSRMFRIRQQLKELITEKFNQKAAASGRVDSLPDPPV
jgi:RNA polymerase sigma-70 factor, ECF subfamily